MSLLEQQNLLARLYTDADLREAFLENPHSIAAEFGLTREEAQSITAILPDEVTFFSRSLVYKRLREVEKLLPICRNVLGDEFARLFEEFSSDYNPTSIKKHLDDALAFTGWLLGRETSPLVRDAARFESAKHRFFASNRRFSYCLLGHDFRRGFDSEKYLPRKTLALWFRFRTRVHNRLI